jgi:dUTP pyrophosphatase
MQDSSMQFNTLKIKLSPNATLAVVEHYNGFKSHHVGDAGIDLLTPEQTNVGGQQTKLIDFLISCEMIGTDGLPTSYYLYPRSSISKTSFIMHNSTGIIDAGYRGNIKAAVLNFTDKESSVMAGSSLFQIVAPNLKPIKIVIVDELSDTSRGAGGFGSTGLLSNTTVAAASSLEKQEVIINNNNNSNADIKKTVRKPRKKT